MQTNFSKRQLRDPRKAAADAILQTCVHCGLCTATCPTYVLFGDERDSPRGRIYLIKEMFENDRGANKDVRTHVGRCLTCLSCMTTCPSNVDYMHLVDLARGEIERTGKKPLKERFLRWLLASILPHPLRLRLALIAAIAAKPFGGLFAKVGLRELSAMLELAPLQFPAKARYRGDGVARPYGTRTKRVAMLAGCVQQTLRPEINDATLRILARQGVEVIVPAKAGCCGALVHHMGKEEEAIAQAKRNVDCWHELMRDETLDAIIINASGCGTTVKDYGRMLAHEPGYARRAEEISKLTVDITEFLADYDIDAPRNWTALRVAYHSACSLQHGQKITTLPRRLLSDAGFTVLEVPEGHICCGSAGTYNILQPKISRLLRDRKVDHIQSTRADIIAAGNVGCIIHLEQGTNLPIVHTVELLDWALGGPCPPRLKHLEDKSHSVDDFIAEAAE